MRLKDPDLSSKIDALQSVLHSWSRVVIAFSGGCDSALLVKAACGVLGAEHVLAVTSQSASLARREIPEIEQFVKDHGIRHRWVDTREMENQDYVRNPKDRCFFCKTELYRQMIPVAREWNAQAILNGINREDLGDWRPGIEAAKAFLIRSPLMEAGFVKKDVRDYAKMLGLETWDKPAAPCLASRFAYGQEISEEGLRRVEAAEDRVRGFGFRIVRVRCLAGSVARIEVAPEELSKLMEHPGKENLLGQIRSLGFNRAEIDPEGYRMGKMNSESGLSGQAGQ
ncbi:ATP-dependent sacrificial sulfur transferase LarE [Omnitrophica bacterium]|nr:ATP-dependent sacrificial sulfur transferase LarE [Candidatus Omnitrophota bacterium]